MTSIRARFAFIGFLFAVIIKFWLVWESEISDAIDDPHEYVLQVLYPLNGGLAYGPGTGWIGRLFYDLGIPYRLGMEAAFLVSCVVLLRALFVWPWRSWLSLGLFVLIIFDPALEELFSHFYSDQPWLVESLLSLSCFVLAIEKGPKPRWGLLIFSVIMLGLSSVTRSVVVPMLVAIMIFTLLAVALALTKFRAKTLKRHLDLIAVSLPTLIFGVCLIYMETCRFNFTHHGFTGLSFVDCNEYKKFYLCLQSVGEPTGDPYYPIDENRRRLIAQAGPDSRWFIDRVEDNAFYKKVGLERYGKYDIPAGWFHFAAFAATMDQTKGNYLDAFAIFRNIEDEIAAANRMGIVRTRTVISLPDTRLVVVARELPSGLLHALQKTLSEPPLAVFADGEGIRAYTNPDFTKALTRRAVVDSPVRDNIWQSLTVIYSWIYTPVTWALYGIALLGLIGAFIFRWSSLEEFPMTLVMPQIFTIFFFIYFSWYALFDASGMPTLARYMIFNHILLFPLIGFYLLTIRRLLRGLQL